MSYEIDLPLPAEADFEGMQARSVRENNAIYEEVLTQEDPYCTYMAGVRWLILQLSREKFAEAASVDETAVRSIEISGSMPTMSTLHRIYNYFHSIDAKHPEHQIPEHFLDLTVRSRYGASKRTHAPEFDHENIEQPHLTVTQLYYRWAIMKTLESVEEKTGISSGGLWQREASGVVPTFEELVRAHKGLKLDEHELDLASSSWSQDRSKQLENWTLPAPLIDLLVHIEVSGKPKSFTAAFIRETLGCTYEQAQTLHAGRMVPFAVVQDIVMKMVPRDQIGDFVEAWEDAFSAEQEMLKFGPEFMRIRDQIGVTNRQLAISMDIRAPEDRGVKKAAKKKVRSETFRPSHLIRETLQNPANSTLAPGGVLVGLLANAAKDAEDPLYEETETSLRELFLANRGFSLRRSGASMHSSPVRLRRDYWGLSREEVAAELEISVKDVEELEQQEDDTDWVLEAVEKLGKAKLDPAVSRWNNLIRPPEPTSVQNLLVSLERRAGSFEALEALLTANRHDTKRGLSGPGLAAIAGRTSVPSWQMIRRITEQSDLIAFPYADADPLEGEEQNVHTMLWQDWCVRYADSLAKDRGVLAPLPRALHHLYGQQAESLRDFMEHMTISYPTQTRIMQRLEAGDSTVDWAHIARTLDAGGLHVDSPQYAFIQGLHQHGTVQKALELARFKTRNEEVFLQKSFAFGLTADERKKHKLPLPASYSKK